MEEHISFQLIYEDAMSNMQEYIFDYQSPMIFNPLFSMVLFFVHIFLQRMVYNIYSSSSFFCMKHCSRDIEVTTVLVPGNPTFSMVILRKEIATYV
jgi:hypothetical protein